MPPENLSRVRRGLGELFSTSYLPNFSCIRMGFVEDKLQCRIVFLLLQIYHLTLCSQKPNFYSEGFGELSILLSTQVVIYPQAGKAGDRKAKQGSVGHGVTKQIRAVQIKAWKGRAKQGKWAAQSRAWHYKAR